MARREEATRPRPTDWTACFYDPRANAAFVPGWPDRPFLQRSLAEHPSIFGASSAFAKAFSFDIHSAKERGPQLRCLRSHAALQVAHTNWRLGCPLDTRAVSHKPVISVVLLAGSESWPRRGLIKLNVVGKRVLEGVALWPDWVRQELMSNNLGSD